ncbi:glycosyltransferase family 39 protein [Moorena sp. SIO3H5]|uniref:glycosyltransferase family 39 protein n=1 Tax=Moorena sp. SIO3H5 TaxID=2607834 RepID=UPI0013BCF226|nr:glycosyltransferase family 39 protein [Moorena sp. SIO3H5]NEO72753.1 glycosyltransferase family 39 protein [Moorena sp. SIO3H5]
MNTTETTPQARKYLLNHLLTYISILFCLFGLLIRLIQYLNNRSLWGDEAALALNIVNRSYGELLAPLDYNQAAPTGFLWLEKLFSKLFGDSEYALRLFPFVSSIVSIWAFYRLANRYASPMAGTIAIAFFACLRYTVYYATELKQYSSDVMVTLLLCLLLIPIGQQVLRQRQIIKISVLGAMAIWVSYPAVFVLAGIELAYLLISPVNRFKTILVNRFGIYATWLGSFGLLYGLTISGTMGNDNLISSWNDRFPDSLFDLVWLLDALGRFFYRPLGFFGFTDGIAIVAFILGCVVLYHRNRVILLVLTAPFLITLVASYLHKYPFRERLVLFLAPLAILIIAEGVAFLILQWRSNHYKHNYTHNFKHIILSIVGVMVLWLLLSPPLLRASNLMIQPELVAEIKPVIEYIKSQEKLGDKIYIYYKGENQFRYYAQKYVYSEGDYTLGKNDLKDIQQLRGQERVWVLFSNAGKPEKNEAVLSELDRIAERIDSFIQPGAFVYLYSFLK